MVLADRKKRFCLSINFIIIKSAEKVLVPSGAGELPGHHR
jgi:hypothetical protein